MSLNLQNPTILCYLQNPTKSYCQMAIDINNGLPLQKHFLSVSGEVTMAYLSRNTFSILV